MVPGSILVISPLQFILYTEYNGHLSHTADLFGISRNRVEIGVKEQNKTKTNISRLKYYTIHDMCRSFFIITWSKVRTNLTLNWDNKHKDLHWRHYWDEFETSDPQRIKHNTDNEHWKVVCYGIVYDS